MLEVPFRPCFERPLTIPTPNPETDGCRFEQDIAIPMRDGTRLAADLYFPLTDGPHPVLIERSPYGKHSSVMVNIGAPQLLARNGYVVAVVDVRGRYASEGVWYPFADDLGSSNSDGYDTVEWLAAQPYCNGKVGVFGGSYAGFNQYTLAANMPPHLVATFPRQAPQSMHTEWVYRGGAMEFAFLIPRYSRRMSSDVLRNREVQYAREARKPQMDLEHGWPLPTHSLFSNPFQWIQDYVSKQHDQDYWRQFDIAPHYESFNRPSLHVASWFDIFCGGTLRNFAGMRSAAKSDTERRAHRLVIGPWIHGPFMAREPEGRITGEMDCGSQATWDYSGNMLAWFDHWLKGVSNEVDSQPDVRYFVMGVNEWRSAADWPPPGIIATNYYFHPGSTGTSASLNDGVLSLTPPRVSTPPVHYTHDPANPVPSLGGAALFNLSQNESTTAEHWEDLNAQAGSRDLRPIEPQCLTFTSDALLEDVEVTGPVHAVIYLASSAIDTDVVVRLCDVYPDGRSMLLCDGIQRARYRNSPFDPSPLIPGEPVELKVDLWATSNVFRAGHRIRVTISGSCYPRFDINPGTGRSMLDGGEMLVSENRIFIDAGRPSHVVLSIMPRR